MASKNVVGGGKGGPGNPGGTYTARGGSERGRLGVSVRSSKVDPNTNRMVKKQNKAAESYKIKDMDKVDKNKIAYEKAKIEKGKTIGKATMAGIGVGMILESKTKLAAGPAKAKEKAKTEVIKKVKKIDKATKPKAK